MPYYPKSQIITNLYTNGDKFTINPNTDAPYIGFYYETSTGDSYTGKNPNDGPNIRLTPRKISQQLPTPSNFNPTPDSPNGITLNNSAYPDAPHTSNISTKEYSRLNGENKFFNERDIPTPSPPILTQEDYNKGFIYRYFVKRRNELKFIEVNKSTYDKFSSKSNTTAYDLYATTQIKWILTGDKNSIYKQNKAIVELKTQKQKWYGFVEYFRDNFTKYSK